MNTRFMLAVHVIAVTPDKTPVDALTTTSD